MLSQVLGVVVGVLWLAKFDHAAPIKSANNIRTTECKDIPFHVIEAPEADSPLPGYQIVLDTPAQQPEEDFMPGSPIIFGLMITGKDMVHEYLGRKSMDSFLNQSYARKVLVIVNDSPDYSMIDGPSEWLRARQLPEAPRERPCLVELRVPPRKFILGELRNIAINAVPLGSVWVQWDDDDWRDTHFVRLELEQMFKRRAPVGYVAAEYRTYLRLNSTWRTANPQGLHGTIMAYKSAKIAKLQYPSLARAEDSKYWGMLRTNNISHTSFSNKPWLYFKLSHGANTWGATHAGENRAKENVWCIRDEGDSCPMELDNEKHRFVFSVYRDWQQVFQSDSTDEN